MFKSNINHLSGDLFSFDNDLNNYQKTRALYLESDYFYQNIFCKIDEEDFSVLFSSERSRPNAPINTMISCLILREKNNWSFNQLFENLHFNLLTKKSLGLTQISDIPFSYPTLFNFQNRLLSHYNETGEHLLDNLFKKLSKNELKRLSLKTNIQRTDSTLISSNIRKYGRLQIMIETLLRFSRFLQSSDKDFFAEQLKAYSNQSSEKYIYNLSSTDLPHEFEKMGELYFKIYTHFKAISEYESQETFILLKRVYEENFRISEKKSGEKEVTLIPSKELCSDILQSPDDPDATYRKKGKEESRGQKINIIETGNLENKIQIITDVSIDKNNVDDSTILNNRLDGLKENTPDINELHTDGGYGSLDNDQKMNELDINHVQTAVRGRKNNIEIIIEQNEEQYNVKCPYQEVISTPTKKKNKAVFDKSKCASCKLRNDCNIYKKYNGIYYFSKEDFEKNKRIRNIKTIPKERRQIRNNVEATMHEFKYRTNHKGKLKVRGFFKTMLFAFTTAIAINFGRSFRYMIENDLITNIISVFTGVFQYIWKEWEFLISRILIKENYLKISDLIFLSTIINLEEKSYIF
jgi:hypothetical protein